MLDHNFYSISNYYNADTLYFVWADQRAKVCLLYIKYVAIKGAMYMENKNAYEVNCFVPQNFQESDNCIFI